MIFENLLLALLLVVVGGSLHGCSAQFCWTMMIMSLCVDETLLLSHSEFPLSITLFFKIPVRVLEHEVL